MKQDIYIVDDNTDHQFLLYKLFKELDIPYSVKFFENGKALYQHIKVLQRTGKASHLPALMILDFNMPGMNGLHLLKLFRQPAMHKEAQTDHIPVLIMSSHVTAPQIVQCYQAGANAVIIKPLDLQVMKNAVLSICKFWLGPIGADGRAQSL